MLKNLKIVFFGCTLAFLLNACGGACGSSKTALLDKQHAMVEKIRTTKPTDWEATDKQMAQFIQECYPQHKAEFDVSDQKKFWVAAVRYYVNRHDGEIKFIAKLVTTDWGREFAKMLMNELKVSPEQALELLK
jgi:hypothetical protein